MSEYQYYEFQTIDRPLVEREQRELRAISSRATISSTRFANSYSWGELKADPGELLERYFDVHVYLANWGARRFSLRLPKRLLNPDVAKLYCRGVAASARAKGKHVVVDFCSEDEGSDWIEDDVGPGRLPGLLPVTAEVERREVQAWAEIDANLATKQPRRYDEVVKLVRWVHQPPMSSTSFSRLMTNCALMPVGE
jgi:hypothetical protein